MSGFYNNWIKVQNPNMPNDIVPMQSDGFQKPFFFGGSQVASNLKLRDNTSMKGYGVKYDFSPYNNNSITDIQSNTDIPKHIGSSKKDF